MLLGAAWELGFLPTDKGRLAAIVGLQAEEFEAIWVVVRPKFVETLEGFFNGRLERHRSAQIEKSEKARRSAHIRWGINDIDAQAHANGDAIGYAVGDAGTDACAMLPDPDPDPDLRAKKTEPKQSRAHARTAIAKTPPFHQQVIEAYHELCPGLPRVKVWSKQRRQALDARIRERCGEGKRAYKIDYWRSLFGEVAKSDFLMRRGKSDFRCDLEWILQPQNFVKVIEGRYAQRQANDAR
jgi:hypothetical protein